MSINKSFIREIFEITGLETEDMNLLRTRIQESISRMDEVNETEQNSAIVEEVRLLLADPCKENWRAINSLLIPEELASLQELYLNQEEERESDQETIFARNPD